MYITWPKILDLGVAWPSRKTNTVNYNRYSFILVILDEDNGPKDYFKLFFTDEIIQLVIIETNRNDIVY